VALNICRLQKSIAKAIQLWETIENRGKVSKNDGLKYLPQKSPRHWNQKSIGIKRDLLFYQRNRHGIGIKRDLLFYQRK